MRRLIALALSLACAATLTACGDGAASDPAAAADAAPLRDLQGARDRAPAPTTAGTLVQLADAAPTRGRIGYVNARRLGELDGTLTDRDVARGVLAAGARRLDLARGDARTAVQVAGATIVSDDRGRRVLGAADDTLARTLAASRPTVNAIMPLAQSTAQSCLGDTIAQTLVGPAVMGSDSALGVGLRSGEDAPAGLKLAICVSPHLVRDLHAAERRLRARFAGTAGAIVTEVEIGEREAVSAVVPAAALPRRELLDLLGGGRALRRLVAG